MKIAYAILAGLMTASLPAVAAAQSDDEAAEFWFNPAATFQVDDDTSIELETAQRLRDIDDGRSDTYFYRLWVNQDVRDDITLSGAVEQRVNTDGDGDETRLMQQMSTAHGIWRTRLRLEQRFVQNADRMGLRIRPRLGVSIPLGDDSPWSFKSDAELFVTLQSTSEGGDHGVTGLRTQVGVAYEVNDRLSLSLGYLRQENFNDDGPDEVGHAPIVGLELTF